ncbi:MAG: hypothetical protein AW12_03131 [Candidatus Accumulibacter sp. BA-94]|nr:MAG: hypothetical protein AW12_03131 [Candidatus Accumulibacter sp. BA-94]
MARRKGLACPIFPFSETSPSFEQQRYRASDLNLVMAAILGCGVFSAILGCGVFSFFGPFVIRFMRRPVNL